MTNLEKAKIILEELDNSINVNWNMKDFYIKAIVKALNKIEKRESSNENNEKL